MLLTFALFSRWAISGEDCDENPENVIADLLGPTQIILGNPDKTLRTEVPCGDLFRQLQFWEVWPLDVFALPVMCLE